jgi:hypothetical protein
MLHPQCHENLKSYTDVVLFIKVILLEMMQLMGDVFNGTTLLSLQVLMLTYFPCNRSFYDETDGVITGSLLAPAVGSSYLEHFKQQVLGTATLKPTCW